MNCAARIPLLLLVLFASALQSSSQSTGQRRMLTLSPDEHSVVRLFYQPPDNNYFHWPLLFRVVEKTDPKWNSAPALNVGRTTYITLPEMQKLITALSAAPLSWQESTAVETLETYKTIHSYGGMGIKVLSSTGTARATIAADKICEMLTPLDATLQTPRALWEFQRFQKQYHCRVHDFDPKKYPDRMP
jgi:hypothetical protein